MKAKVTTSLEPLGGVDHLNSLGLHSGRGGRITRHDGGSVLDALVDGIVSLAAASLSATTNTVSLLPYTVVPVLVVIAARVFFISKVSAPPDRTPFVAMLASAVVVMVGLPFL